MCLSLPPNKDWIDLLGALLTPTIAGFGIYIAYQQGVINKNRLKHELFEKRYAIYEKIGFYISEILISGTVKAGSDIEFLRDTKASALLFDSRIEKLVSQIYQKSVELHCLETELDALTSDVSRKENVRKQSEINDWLKEQLSSMPSLFEEYLHLEH